MPDDRPRINPIALAMARLDAPMREALRRVGQVEMSPVDCPKCGTTLAVFVPIDGCLYRWIDGRRGDPLSLDRRAEVPVRCEQCHTTRHTSGRGVGRALHNGRPPLQ